jgi:hypothetical protein
MDNPEQLRRLLAACERAIELVDPDSPASADGLLLEDLQELRSRLHERLRAADPGSYVEPSEP